MVFPSIIKLQKAKLFSLMTSFHSHLRVQGLAWGVEELEL